MDLMKVLFSVFGFIFVGVSFVIPEYAIVFVIIAVWLVWVMSLVEGIVKDRDKNKVSSFLDMPPPPTPPNAQNISQHPPKQYLQSTPQNVPTLFCCRYCGKKFEEEIKLRRHIGKSHVDKLDI